jgi:hypothetical protein
MTLSFLLRLLGVVAFTIAMLLFVAAFTIGSGFGGLFFVALGLALWLLSTLVHDRSL